MKIFFGYIGLCVSSRIPSYKNHAWEKIQDEARVRIQQGAQNKKKQSKNFRKKFQLGLSSKTNSMIAEVFEKDLTQKCYIIGKFQL